MAKTFINFEEKLIDVNSIKFIERNWKWSKSEHEMMFTIEINNPDRIKVENYLPYYNFEYRTEKDRDIIYQELLDKLEEYGVEIL